MLLGVGYSETCDSNDDLGTEGGCGGGQVCSACCDLFGDDYFMCSAQESTCEEAGGTWYGTSECPINGSVYLEIQNVNLNERTFDIYMTNDVDIYGLQIVFSGLSEISVTPGGIVPDSWFFDSYNHDYEHGGAELLGLDFQLSPILAGEGILTTVTFMDEINDLEICIPLQYNCENGYNEQSCYLNLDPSNGYSASDNNPVFSDAFGNAIPVTIGDCYINDDCEEVFNEGYELGAQSGDINLDGQHNILDIVTAVNMILNP